MQIKERVTENDSIFLSLKRIPFLKQFIVDDKFSFKKINEYAGCRLVNKFDILTREVVNTLIEIHNERERKKIKNWRKLMKERKKPSK
jgi:predicted transcriptional regulator